VQKCKPDQLDFESVNVSTTGYVMLGCLCGHSVGIQILEILSTVCLLLNYPHSTVKLMSSVSEHYQQNWRIKRASQQQQQYGSTSQ